MERERIYYMYSTFRSVTMLARVLERTTGILMYREHKMCFRRVRVQFLGNAAPPWTARFIATMMRMTVYVYIIFCVCACACAVY